ncbi:hypothetical protein ACFVT5_41360 [Streptomyces sp. NPDC058001]|uniref:hypothetical protein n=1 Tax=Streptomyces sp. NPDC058001 TaxID=3346300 RepID=UPI0036E52443
MSSTYYVLCLSHDPATTAGEYRTPEKAADAIKAGIEGHPACDLLVEHVSGGPVEIGCPPHYYHRDVEWVDVEWLRLLARAYGSTDPGVLDAVRKGRFTCWSRDRLHRLRYPLGTDEELEERP